VDLIVRDNILEVRLQDDLSAHSCQASYQTLLAKFYWLPSRVSLSSLPSSLSGSNISHTIAISSL